MLRTVEGTVLVSYPVTGFFPALTYFGGDKKMPGVTGVTRGHHRQCHRLTEWIRFLIRLSEVSGTISRYIIRQKSQVFLT